MFANKARTWAVCITSFLELLVLSQSLLQPLLMLLLLRLAPLSALPLVC
jgi:hypothetical protein